MINDAPKTTKKKLPPDPRLEVVRENLRMAMALSTEHNSGTVAQQTGFSRNLVSNFTAGRSSISYENLLKTCDVINIPIGLLHIPNAMNRANIKKVQSVLAEIAGRIPTDEPNG